ncbi:cytochrome c oxidase subunit 7A1, mitochondrial isoform X1 [Neofelis nebulosa]|uniref:cytochrome c oxidase subunit 7A1, mitochondrial isoform X1 n=1 Tax=Neofelis nebulosa TaxID=61452 RepID=UPI00272D01CE|nr:cytochrome c oxidase subunit 7A1, mitochondrial isoform X1 [Neofelis nebulosa]
MRALRVRAPKSWAGDPNPKALAPITRLTEHPGIWGVGTSTARNRFENRVAEKQKVFQADNDLPVHLKGGATDNILYRLTMGLCLGGTVYSLYCLGWASFPHNK